MTDHVPGGCVLLANKIFQSALWRKPPQYIRSFLWLIGKAAFEDGHTFKGHILKRGELITTHNEIADGLSYCFNRAIIKPSQKEIRIMLSWLQSEGMILMKPLIDGTSPNKGRPIELTRAYVGLLIYIINYDTYQDLRSYKGMDKGRPSSEQGQLREIREKEENILSSVKEIIEFLNAQSSKNFSHRTKATVSHIKARLSEGWTVEDFKKVITIKCNAWLSDPKMSPFVRPDTLFGSKFESYLNEQPVQRKASW